MEILQGMYGLPQAGILTKNLLAQRLINRGYYQVKKHQDNVVTCVEIYFIHIGSG